MEGGGGTKSEGGRSNNSPDYDPIIILQNFWFDQPQSITKRVTIAAAFISRGWCTSLHRAMSSVLLRHLPRASSGDGSLYASPAKMDETRAGRRARRNKRVDPSADRWLNLRYYNARADSFASYDPESWGQTISIRLPRFVLLPWLSVSLWCLSLTYYIEVINPAAMVRFSFDMDAHVVLGSALSFLVVFRTNSSYARWWEARCLWEDVIGACSSHATSVASALRSKEATEQCFALLIALVVSMKAMLRGEKIRKKECGGRLDWNLVKEINGASVPPLMCAHKLGRTVRANLPQSDPNGGDSMIPAAIFMSNGELVCAGQRLSHAVPVHSALYLCARSSVTVCFVHSTCALSSLCVSCALHRVCCVVCCVGAAARGECLLVRPCQVDSDDLRICGDAAHLYHECVAKGPLERSETPNA